MFQVFDVSWIPSLITGRLEESILEINKYFERSMSVWILSVSTESLEEFRPSIQGCFKCSMYP